MRVPYPLPLTYTSAGKKYICRRHVRSTGVHPVREIFLKSWASVTYREPGRPSGREHATAGPPRR